MKNLLLLLFFTVVLSFTVTAQDNPRSVTGNEGELEKIYSNLEYNTIAFDDLKNKWFINDPGFIRELYNKFAVKNAFRKNGQPANVQFVKDKANAVFEGEVIVDLRRRYYDDEFEYFAFISSDEAEKVKPEPLFDPVTDGFYLKEVIGDRLYNKLQEQSYFFSDVTKDVYESKYGYYFDIYLSLLDPKLTFWSTTSGARNKYLLSAFGKWGIDNIFLPGWYSSEYFAGLGLTYYDALGDDPTKYSYELKVGLGLEASKPYDDDLPDRPLYKSGNTAFFSLSGNMLKNVARGFDNLYLNMEGMFSFSDYEYNDYGIYSDNRNFVSVKNYFHVDVEYRDIANMFEFGDLYMGLGVSTHDVHKFRVDQATRTVEDLENKDPLDKFVHYGNFNIGIRNDGGLIQHDINLIYGYNAIIEYHYYGVELKAMISNTFGFEIKVMNNSGIKENSFDGAWRGDYIVFSPILRINY